MSEDCRDWKYDNNYKKFEKAEKNIDGDEHDMVLCLLTMENKKEYANKKIWFIDGVKQPLEAGMMCTIDSDTFYSFMKNTLIGDSGASCHITNDDTGMYNASNINESIQGSSGITPTKKKSKLCVNVH